MKLQYNSLPFIHSPPKFLKPQIVLNPICFLFNTYIPFFSFTLLFFEYSYLHLHPTVPLCATHPCLPPLNLPTLAFFMCPLYMFLDGPSPISLHSPSPPSHLVTVCSLFQCLWLYFTHLFVLLNRFNLQVKSYGICLHNLAYFTEHNALQFHPCCCEGQALLLSNTYIAFNYRKHFLAFLWHI